MREATMHTNSPQITVPLVVAGVNLDDDTTVDLIGSHFDGLTWHSEAGHTVATLLSTSGAPIDDAADVARAITATIPGAWVPRTDPQLVSLGDIADRLNLSSEAVRLWTSGKRRAGTPFPAPTGHVSTGRTTMKILSWPDVLTWLRQEYTLDPEPGVNYLTNPDNHALAIKLDAIAPTAAAS